MRVTIIGAGVVGQATGAGLEACGHTVDYYDPAKGLSYATILTKCDATFICVPTPHRDTESIHAALRTCVNQCKDQGLVVIKSTVFPTFTEAAQVAHPRLRILFSPEFLSEQSATEDALKPARQIVGYTQGNEDEAKSLIRELPSAPYEAVIPATEAELVKYFSNGFFAVKVAFTNLMYDLTQQLGVSYRPLLEAALHDPMIAPHHLDPHHKGYRGFGGKCLPKDLRTLIDIMADHGDVDSEGILDAVDEYNYELLRCRLCERCGSEYTDDDPPVSTAGKAESLCDDCWSNEDPGAAGSSA